MKALIGSSLQGWEPHGSAIKVQITWRDMGREEILHLLTNFAEIFKMAGKS